MVIRRARSSWFSIIRSNQRRSFVGALFEWSARQAGRPLSAASMARRVLRRRPSLRLPMISPVAGLFNLDGLAVVGIHPGAIDGAC